MIDIDFTSANTDLKNKKLSAIFSADNFVYTLFDEQDTMVACRSMNDFRSFDSLVEELAPSSISIVVKTIHFGHFGDVSRIPFQSPAMKIEKLTGQEKWCAYEAPLTPRERNVRHFSTVLNHHYYLRSNKVFQIHFDQERIHFYLQKDGEIVLYNCYPMASYTDLLYYYTFISQSIDVDPNTVPLYLSGLIDRNSKAFIELAALHNDIRFISLDQFSIHTTRQDLRKHYYFDHFINILCG